MCLIYPVYPPLIKGRNGDAKYTEKLAQHLAISACEVCVISSITEHHIIRYSPQSNLSIYPIVKNWDLRGLVRGDYQKVKHKLKEVKPDIINIIYPNPRLNSKYLLPYFIKFISPKIPIITTLFQFFPKRGNVLYKFMALLLYFSSNKIHFHDEGLMEIFNKIFPFFKKKTIFIPLGNLVSINNQLDGISKLEIMRRINLSEEFKYISFVGYWYPSKGVDILIKALYVLISKRLKIKLLLLGGHSKKDMNKYEKSILKLIEKLELQNDIFITGYCSDDMMVNYLLCSEVCVFPFRSNMMGRSSIMLPISLGLPIIISRLVKKSNFLVDRKNAFFVPRNDPNALANGIEKMLSNESLRNYIATNVGNLAERISWENIAREWMKMYKQMLEPRPCY